MTAASDTTYRPCLPFSDREYDGRIERVRALMVERGVDVLFIMSTKNICYLTGFDPVWFPPRIPHGVVIEAGSNELTYFDYERHREYAYASARFDHGVFFDGISDPIDDVAEAFRSRGWLKRRIGVEWHSRTPTGVVIRQTADALAGEGAQLVRGDWIVDRVALVKSPAEIAVMRRAGAIVDDAFRLVAEEVAAGMTELEVAALLAEAMAHSGGEESAVNTIITSGDALWRRSLHSRPSARALARGDLMKINVCGVIARYHTNLCRTFVIGDDHPACRTMLDTMAESVHALRAAAHLSEPLTNALAAAEAQILSHYAPTQIRWVGGVSLGIAELGDWNGHVSLNGGGYETFSWEPGYVTSYGNILVDDVNKFTASYVDSLVMTDHGLEIISQLPRGLVQTK